MTKSYKLIKNMKLVILYKNNRYYHFFVYVVTFIESIKEL